MKMTMTRNMTSQPHGRRLIQRSGEAARHFFSALLTIPHTTPPVTHGQGQCHIAATRSHVIPGARHAMPQPQTTTTSTLRTNPPSPSTSSVIHEAHHSKTHCCIPYLRKWGISLHDLIRMSVCLFLQTSIHHQRDSPAATYKSRSSTLLSIVSITPLVGKRVHPLRLTIEIIPRQHIRRDLIQLRQHSQQTGRALRQSRLSESVPSPHLSFQGRLPTGR